MGRLEQELHKDLQAQRSLPAGTSRAYQGAPRDTIQWQRFTNYSQAGFVHYRYAPGTPQSMGLGFAPHRLGLRALQVGLWRTTGRGLQFGVPTSTCLPLGHPRAYSA